MIEIFDLSSCYMQKKKKLIVRYKLKLTLVYYWYILISLISDRPWALFCLFLRHLCTHFHRSALTGRELIWVTTCLHRYDQPHQPGEVTQAVNKGLYLCRYYITDKQKKKTTICGTVLLLIDDLVQKILKCYAYWKASKL